LSTFLSCNDLCELTGRKVKSKQIEALRKMGVAFFVNACGKPVVAVAAVEGRKVAPQPKQWSPPT
jgi:hypothetical protein